MSLSPAVPQSMGTQSRPFPVLTNTLSGGKSVLLGHYYDKIPLGVAAAQVQ